MLLYRFGVAQFVSPRNSQNAPGNLVMVTIRIRVEYRVRIAVRVGVGVKLGSGLFQKFANCAN